MKLSILIPVHNAARTVGQTIASLEQIEDGWEHIDCVVVCDDASTDDSLGVIQHSPFTKCQILVLHHETNCGESGAYKTMEACLPESTEWFLILQADDLALPNFITRNLAILRMCDQRVASVSSTFWAFDDKKEELAIPDKDIVLLAEATEESIQSTALVGCWWHISGALVNRMKWNEFGGRNPRLPYSGDWDLLLRWQLHGYTVGHSLIATTKYRQNYAGSISTSSYLKCTDLWERTEIALGLPTVFHGRTKRVLAFRIFKAAVRRGVKFLLQRRVTFAMNAIKVGGQSLLRLLIPAAPPGRKETD